MLNHVHKALCTWGCLENRVLQEITLILPKTAIKSGSAPLVSFWLSPLLPEPGSEQHPTAELVVNKPAGNTATRTAAKTMSTWAA